MISIIFLSFLFAIKSISASILFEDNFYLNHTKTDVNFRNYFNPYFNETLNYLKFLSKNNEINSSCRSSLQRWIDGIENYDHWALKQSTGKTVNGKLVGRHINFGSFDYCSSFIGNRSENINFDGKYCLVSLQTKDSQDFKQLENYKNFQTKLSERSKRLIDFNLGSVHGVCFPSTCDINEMTTLFNKNFESLGFLIIPPKKCTSIAEPEPLTKLQIVSFSIFVIFILLCVIAYFYENDFLSNFSISKNYRIIYCNFSTEKDDELAETASILHGLKALLVILSTAFHSFFAYIIFLMHPISSVRETIMPYEELLDLNLSTLLKTFSERVHLVADLLFFFGGFFAFFAWFAILKRKKTLSMDFIPFFISRYIRMAIAVIPAILIYFMLPVLGFGPLYSDLTNHFTDNCKEGFYYIFALIGHKQAALDMCLIPAWYFNVDFQIYILNYFLIFYLITKPIIGFLLSLCQMLIFSIITLVLFRKDEIPTFFNFVRDYLPYDMSDMENLYFNLYSHYNTWVIGMICAYLVQNKIRPKMFSNKFVWLGLSSLISLMALSVFTYPYFLQRTNSSPNDFIKLLYPVFDKIFVSLWLFWVVYSLLSGYLDFFKPIFCFDIWVPVSRLSFSIIVGQFIYLGWSYPTLRVVYSVNFVTLIKEFVACFVFSFLIGNFTFFFFEAPLIGFMRKYFGFKTRQEKCLKIAQKEAKPKEINNNIECKDNQVSKIVSSP